MGCEAHVRPTHTGIQDIFACEIQNLGKFVLESGIPIYTIAIQNPNSTDKDWNLESTAWDPESKTVLT